MLNYFRRTDIIKFSFFVFFGTVLFSMLNGQDTLWLRRFDRGASDWGMDIVLDRSGNSIVAGYSWNTVTNGYDILLIKYTPNGDTIWARYYDGGESECLYRVNLDRQGNIICTGWSSNDTIEAQCLVIKFSPEGNFLWKQEYRIRDIDSFCDAAIDISDNIIITGLSYSYSGSGDLIGFLRKYDSNGSVAWTKFYDWSDELYGITVSEHSQFFVTGRDSLWRMLTVCFDTLGDTIWTRRNSWGGRDCVGLGIALDSFGNIIVAGHLRDFLHFDWGIIKYTQTGDTTWTRTVDFTPNDLATNVATDIFGNIYVCGTIGLVDTIGDYLLVKYNPSGETIWTTRYDNGYDDVALGVVVDNYGNPIVTGYSSNGTNDDIVTIKYRGTSGIEEHFLQDTKCFMPEIYPNPFRQMTKIRYALTKTGNVSLKIYDITGKLVRNLFDSIQKASIHTINWDGKDNQGKRLPSGLYFLCLRVNGTTETKRIVVSR
jgi:hypothetical protein